MVMQYLRKDFFKSVEKDWHRYSKNQEALYIHIRESARTLGLPDGTVVKDDAGEPITREHVSHHTVGSISAMLKASANPKNQKYSFGDQKLLSDALNRRIPQPTEGAALHPVVETIRNAAHVEALSHPKAASLNI